MRPAGIAVAKPDAHVVIREVFECFGSPARYAQRDDHFGTDGQDQKERVESVLRNRSRIELMARAKYLSWLVEEPGAVLIKTTDVPKLFKDVSVATPPKPSPRSTGKARTKR